MHVVSRRNNNSNPITTSHSAVKWSCTLLFIAAQGVCVCVCLWIAPLTCASEMIQWDWPTTTCSSQIAQQATVTATLYWLHWHNSYYIHRNNTLILQMHRDKRFRYSFTKVLNTQFVILHCGLKNESTLASMDWFWSFWVNSILHTFKNYMQLHIWNPQPRFVYSLYNFYGPIR